MGSGRYRRHVKRLLEVDGAALALAESTVTLLLLQADELQLRELLDDAEVARTPVVPALVLVTGEGIRVLTEVLGTAWAYDDRALQQHLPDRRPHGKSEWGRFNYALHAAGCLAGGVQLDWELQVSFWQQPLWPAQLTLLALLQDAAHRDAGLSREHFLERLQSRLSDYRNNGGVC